jgi:hypothetical protein
MAKDYNVTNPNSDASVYQHVIGQFSSICKKCHVQQLSELERVIGLCYTCRKAQVRGEKPRRLPSYSFTRK